MERSQGQTYWCYQAIKRDNFMEAFYSKDGVTWEKFNVNDSVGYIQVVVHGFKAGW